MARLRERGHSLDEIREATEKGRLAYGFVEEMFPDAHGRAGRWTRPRRRRASSPR